MNDLARFERFLDKTNECWTWTGATLPNGYGNFWFQGKSASSHRVAWMLYRGLIPSGGWVLHTCDVRTCCRPDHLYIGTAKQNTADSLARNRFATGQRHGMRAHPERRARGERHGLSVMTEEGVRRLRRMASDGATQASLAREFKIDGATVTAIIRRKTWVHV